MTTGPSLMMGGSTMETVAEPVRLADIGRKLLLATGRELGDLLEVFLTAGAVRAGRG
jgi:hydroxymethylpyrimidine pyrophosphatase-like HAD family hydrolase